MDYSIDIASVRAKVLGAYVPYKANDNLSEVLSPDDLAVIEGRAALLIGELLDTLQIDTHGDPNTKETGKRVAKMLVREVFAGRYQPEPSITIFPNTKKLDELYVVGPAPVRSSCSHHLVPVVGQAWVGVLPGDKLLGLSKFARLIEWYAARPQMQEELAVQIADDLERKLQPKGLAVVIRCEHSCMTWRGVRAPSGAMTTSVMRGRLFSTESARAEFFRLAAGHGL